ncbi:MAG TPA: hypothetical protein VNX22_09465 [Acidobacteriaceae bacterium]|jgi:hypothetical protein|nr:hypothetical protein [Acidobacteriaceae bacterium]
MLYLIRVVVFGIVFMVMTFMSVLHGVHSAHAAQKPGEAMSTSETMSQIR